jgi:uncharacterized membrane protein YgdD (TMEM256/DUF423 family)
MNMQKLILLSGTMMAALSVTIGAFGAHTLKDLLEANQRTETFTTAVTYQFCHSLALLIIGMLMYKSPHRFLEYAAWSHIAGIVIFSGSLYILCISTNTKWGMITPIGGLLFITGWLLLAIAIGKSL